MSDPDMHGSKPMIISVIGGYAPNHDAIVLAERVGIELAGRGIIVCCGGLAGVMEAACRGAKSVGGTTIGILPGSNHNEANTYVDIPICTSMGYSRNVIVVHTGRAVIAVDGAYGTLSEIGHALAEDIPVIGLDTWSLSLKSTVDDKIIIASDPVDAVEKAIEAACQREAKALSKRGQK